MSYELTIERICRCSCCRTRETFSSRSTAAVASARPAGSAACGLKALTKAESTWLGLGLELGLGLANPNPNPKPSPNPNPNP